MSVPLVGTYVCIKFVCLWVPMHVPLCLCVCEFVCVCLCLDVYMLVYVHASRYRVREVFICMQSHVPVLSNAHLCVRPWPEVFWGTQGCDLFVPTFS